MAMESRFRILKRKTTGPMWILETSFGWLNGGQIGEGRTGGQRIPPVRCVVVLTRKVMELGCGSGRMRVAIIKEKVLKD